MRIKVEVKKLLAHLNNQHQAALIDYTKDMDDYQKKVKAHHDGVLAFFTKVVSDLKSGALTPHDAAQLLDYNHRRVFKSKGITAPDKPRKPEKNLRIIERLRMSSDTHVTMNEDEFKEMGL